MRLALLLAAVMPALCLASPIIEPTNLGSEFAFNRTLLMKQDHLDMAGPEFQVFVNRGGEASLTAEQSPSYRVATALSLGYLASVTESLSGERVAYVDEKPLEWDHVYRFAVGNVAGTMTQCRVCISDTWTVEFGSARFNITDGLIDWSYAYTDAKTSEIVATVTKRMRPFHRDQWIIEVNSPLPDGFFLATMAAVVDED